MTIIITAELASSNDTADPDDSTGLTDVTYEGLWSFLTRLGFDDIEVQAHDDEETP